MCPKPNSNPLPRRSIGQKTGDWNPEKNAHFVSKLGPDAHPPRPDREHDPSASTARAAICSPNPEPNLTLTLTLDKDGDGAVDEGEFVKHFEHAMPADDKVRVMARAMARVTVEASQQGATER